MVGKFLTIQWGLQRQMLENLFEMAAMPLPCYGILVVVGNLPRIFPGWGEVIDCYVVQTVSFGHRPNH